MVLVDCIVKNCIELYKKLPKTGKPNAKEWTVISCIVGVFNNSDIRVLSMGTGSKCIGQSSMSSKGDILNDSHAEVIARRAFLKFLFLEIIQYNLTNSSDIVYLDETNGLRFCIKESVKFYFVTSMSPCGDASIIPKVEMPGGDLEFLVESLEMTRSTLKRSNSVEKSDFKKLKIENSKEIPKSDIFFQEEDIHRTGAKCLPHSSVQDSHLPGAMYHSTGAVRTKPGRGDPTLSLSCSDKIAKWNAIGWQGALLSLLIKTPLFMEAIICGGGCPFSNQSFNRAVNERIQRDIFIPIFHSEIIFPDIKEAGKMPNPSSIIWWNSGEGTPEVSINGRKQGVTKKNLNKKSARTSICKKELFLLFERAVSTLPEKKKFVENLLGGADKTLNNITYKEIKLMSQDYQRRWEVVKQKCFKVWSSKPGDLLNFTVKDEE